MIFTLVILLQHAVCHFLPSYLKRFELARLPVSTAVQGISITTSSNTAYELTKQGREQVEGYEPVGTPPKGPSTGSGNHEGQYDVPKSPPCKAQLPAIPSSVAGAEEVDGVYESIPGEQ